MYRPLVLTLAWAIAGSTARADSPSDPTAKESAARAWAIADAVLGRHVDPPARQQMFLAGIKAVAKAGRHPTPPGLARRASDVSTPEQLAALLAEIEASPKVEVARAAPEAEKRRAVPDDRTTEEVFLDGLLSVVPGGAALMSEKERKVQESFGANLYVGIQVALGLDEKANKPAFREVLEGGPAEDAGAKSGDLIEEIGGVSAEGMPLAKVVDRLRGEEGTDILVKFRRPESGEVFTRTMTRGRLPRSTVQGLVALPGHRWKVRVDGPLPIGYLKITEISGSTPQEIRAFARQLESEGMKALILDLRWTNNAGFHPTVLLADALLDGGIIGRVQSAEGTRTIRAEPDALFRGWPMVVIADGASLAEVSWLCEALRDNRRATIAGNPVVGRDPMVREAVPLPGGDPLVREMVTLPGGEWTVQMATGRLMRGDGRPLPVFDPKLMGKAARSMVEDGPIDPYSPTAPGAPGRPADATKAPDQVPLGQAREVLEEALRSAGK